MKQRFTSASTSINKSKCPAVYGMKKAQELLSGKSVIDIGGGKFDIAIEVAKAYDAKVSIYDPYNRTAEHNEKVMSSSYDCAIISNVLNVIDSEDARKQVLLTAYNKADVVLITVYEGDRSGIGRQTGSDSWQENRVTADYIREVETVFPKVEKYGKLIVARKRGKRYE